ncbi:MAG: ParB/RepB/Spo0J family partition protein [Oscillospiraceae bacterium]|nr:ParB/RepB/Spo0J family partition protein [Oscillospiraceae bacterium]
MAGKIQKIKIEKIINWSENPRHAVGNNETDTLQKLFNAVGTQYMLNLAEDIQEHGLLGNQQIVVVYSESIKKYVVYEGNRRVAAIKLLMNPEGFNFLDKATIDKAKRIAKDEDIIDTLECYVTDEDEAFFIMERVHSGEDKGRGTKEWGAREKDTFQVRRNNVKNLSYLIDFYVRKYYDGLDITTILSFTTIQRIFNNREIRKIIGLDIENEDTFTIDRIKLVIEASKWVVKESEEAGVAVTRLFNRARTIEDKLIPWIQRYINEHDAKKPDTTDSPDKERGDFGQGDAVKDSGDVSANGNKRQDKDDYVDNLDSEKTNISKTDDEKRKTGGENKASDRTSNASSGGSKNLPYFFQGIDYSNLNPNDADSHGVSAVCRELQLFSDKKMVTIYPLASAFLVRSIIEQSIKYYSKKHMIQGQNKYIWENIKSIDQLSKIIKNFNRNLSNYIVNGVMRQYFTDLFGDYEKSIDPLNWVVHKPAEYQLDANTLIELPRKGLLALINFMLS